MGKATLPRPLPAAELHRLIDAARTVVDAENELADAGRAARRADASWTQIGDALGLTHH